MAKVRRFATSAAWWVMGNRLAGESKKGGEYSANPGSRTTVHPIGGWLNAAKYGTF
jgi:hypothetical protein